MPSWTKDEYAAYNARSASARRRKACDIPSSTKPEPAVCDEPVAEKAGKAEDTAGISRCLVRITSYRRRLLDVDNLAGGCKYFLDCCKYSQLIQDDRPDCIELVIKQEKVFKKTEECTEILITPLCPMPL